MKNKMRLFAHYAYNALSVILTAWIFIYLLWFFFVVL